MLMTEKLLRVRLNFIRRDRHESNTQSPNFIAFPKLKNIKFGKTNCLVIYLNYKLKT